MVYVAVSVLERVRHAVFYIVQASVSISGEKIRQARLGGPFA
jgi:hypothetical protein